MDTDKENAWRTLQGLKQIQPWKCRFGWHKWTRFEVKSDNPSYDGFNFKQIAYCECADCGLPRIERPVILLDKNNK